ncbi:MAG: HD domain-containing protein [Humidesulfovibrio sp.]|nr:HD domain-containing protein [Humidesulfovibrio sp.]
MAVRLFEFLSSLSGALDLMSPEVVGHHKRVAYVAARLGKLLGASREERTELFMAALLHDVGGFSRQSRLAALSFETDGGRHAELGYRLLRTNPLLESTAVIVRHHHTAHSRLSSFDEPERKLFLAGVLNLADRVDALTCRQEKKDPAQVMSRLGQRAGELFDPLALEALGQFVGDPEFWAQLAGEDPTSALSGDTGLFQEHGMSRAQLMQASTAFSQIIDFRSRFTATHSRGVAETAVCLAEKAGLSANDQTAMRLAGDLHDLGKLAVPTEIIDKPGPLDADELAVMRRHPELGEAILASVPGLGRVATWASQHHEQPGGQGYPRRISGSELSLGSRIMTVADVFTALREDRPYRAGLTTNKVMRILGDLARNAALDPELVSLATRHQDELDQRRRQAQATAAEEFHQFYSGLPAL